MDEKTYGALERLFQLASHDTGQSRICASFLLAWHNAADLGGFDLSDLFSLDAAVADDMSLVFAYLGRRPGAIYPGQLGFRTHITALIARWRPQVAAARA